MTTTTPASSTSIDRVQAQKAVDALLKHHEKVSAEREETELIGREEHVWLVVNTKRGTTKRKMMPKRM
jgi:ribosome biogenesis protein UTP30